MSTAKQDIADVPALAGYTYGLVVACHKKGSIVKSERHAQPPALMRPPTLCALTSLETAHFADSLRHGVSVSDCATCHGRLCKQLEATPTFFQEWRQLSQAAAGPAAARPFPCSACTFQWRSRADILQSDVPSQIL